MKDLTATEQATDRAELVNAVGLHARPSVKLTQLAKTFECRVEIALSADGPWVDAKSPVKVMRVKAPRGAVLHVRTSGPGARGGGGCADGPRSRRLRRPDQSAGRSETWLSFACSAAARRREWRKALWPFWMRPGGRGARPRARKPRRPWRFNRRCRERWPKSRPWLERRLARPPICSAFRSRCCPMRNWSGPALERVGAGESAAAAWEAAMEAEIAGYRDAGDDHFSARTADLEDIRDRVLGHLEPGAASPVIPDGSVVVAADLPISRFLAIDWAQGGAILLTQGSPTSHVAMLARARGVPMVVGLDGAADAMAGREALVDAATGEVVLDPTEATRAVFAAKADREKTANAASAAFRRALPSPKTGPGSPSTSTPVPPTNLKGSIPRFATGSAWFARRSCFTDLGPCRTKMPSTRPTAASSPGPTAGLSPFALWTLAATSRSRA